MWQTKIKWYLQVFVGVSIDGGIDYHATSLLQVPF
jgi:hypothetical protein